MLSHQALRAVIAVRRSGMVMGPIAMWSSPYKLLIFLGLLTSFEVSGRLDARARMICESVSQFMK